MYIILSDHVLSILRKRSMRTKTFFLSYNLQFLTQVCAYESMQAGQYRLKRLGITKLTHPTGLSSAMNQLPDEAIALAAASHIERELQITPWNLSSNFVSCTNQVSNLSISPLLSITTSLTILDLSMYCILQIILERSN